MGAGSAGSRHVKALLSAGARPVVLTRRPSAAAKLNAHGVETARSLAEALVLGATACVVATETARHVQDAREALALGLDVLIEKPLAVDAVEGLRLVAAARRAGRRAFVACVMRFSPSLLRLRALLPSIGGLHAVRVECRSYLPDWRPGRDHRVGYGADASQGGVLRDLIHEIDYAGWLFGFPKKTYGFCANLGRLGIRSEEAAEICWRLPEGGTLSIGLDYLARVPRRGLTADGERGYLCWNALTGTITLALAGRKPRVETVQESADERFLRQARSFLAALDGKRDARLATLEDGIRALAVCDRARTTAP